MSNSSLFRSIVLGCTASGKTQWALDLFGGTQTELISIDSCQVYQELSVGSAKLADADRTRLPHHVIDCVSVTEAYDVGRYLLDANRAHEMLTRQAKPVLYLGGSMLYADALMHGLNEIPPLGAEVRAHWQERLRTLGVEALWAHLLSLDPSYESRLHPHDSQRIVRAISVLESTGRPLYSYWTSKTPSDYSLAMIVPESRFDLRASVVTRTWNMLHHGMIEETQAWYTHSRDIPYPSLRSIGYRQVWSYLLGDIPDLEHLHERIVVATLQYVKQQMTWMKRWQSQALCVSLHDRHKLNEWAKRQALV